MNSQKKNPLNRPLTQKEQKTASKRRPIVLKLTDLERIKLTGQKALPTGVTIVLNITATGTSIGYTEEELKPLNTLDDLLKLQGAARILKKSESISASSERAKGILVLAAQNVPEKEDENINFGPTGAQTINDIGLESSVLDQNMSNFRDKATHGFLGKKLEKFVYIQCGKIIAMNKQRIADAALGKPKANLDEIRLKHGVHAWTHAKFTTRNFFSDDPQDNPSALFFPKKIGNSISTSITEWENTEIAADLDLIVEEKLSRQLLSPIIRKQFFEISKAMWSDVQKLSFLKRKYAAFPPYGAAQNCAAKRSIPLSKEEQKMPFAPLLQAYNKLQQTACGQVPRHVDSQRYWSTIHGVTIRAASGSAIPDLVGRYLKKEPKHRGPFDELLFTGMTGKQLQQNLDTSFTFYTTEDERPDAKSGGSTEEEEKAEGDPDEEALKKKKLEAEKAAKAATSTTSSSGGVSGTAGSSPKIEEILVRRNSEGKVIITDKLSERMKKNPSIWAIKTKARKANTALARTPLRTSAMGFLLRLERSKSAYFHDAASDIINLLQSFQSEKLQVIAYNSIVATMQADPKNELFYTQAGSEIQLEESMGDYLDETNF